MNLQSTKILITKLKKDTVEIDPMKYSDIDNYHCNLLKFGMVNSILITNDKTLYSFFIYGLTSNDFKHFGEVVKQSVFKLLLESGFSQNQFEKVLNSMESINYSKTSNRSVISTMNEMKRHIESGVYGGDNILEINRFINQILYKTNNYKKSKDLFEELLS